MQKKPLVAAIIVALTLALSVVLIKRNMSAENLWYFIAIVLVIGLLGLRDSSESISIWRFRELEKKVDLALQKLGIDYNNLRFSELSENVKQLVVSGERIKAISEFRKETGVGLNEAKEFIDDYLVTLKSN